MMKRTLFYISLLCIGMCAMLTSCKYCNDPITSPEENSTEEAIFRALRYVANYDMTLITDSTYADGRWFTAEEAAAIWGPDEDMFGTLEIVHDSINRVIVTAHIYDEEANAYGLMFSTKGYVDEDQRLILEPTTTDNDGYELSYYFYNTICRLPQLELHLRIEMMDFAYIMTAHCQMKFDDNE